MVRGNITFLEIEVHYNTRPSPSLNQLESSILFFIFAHQMNDFWKKLQRNSVGPFKLRFRLYHQKTNIFRTNLFLTVWCTYNKITLKKEPFHYQQITKFYKKSLWEIFTIYTWTISVIIKNIEWVFLLLSDIHLKSCISIISSWQTHWFSLVFVYNHKIIKKKHVICQNWRLNAQLDAHL